MTSASRVGARDSGHKEETVRLGLTEAEAETLAMLLQRTGGSNGRGDMGSRRVHVDRILRCLTEAGVHSTDDGSDPIRGAVSFLPDKDYDYPLTIGEAVPPL